jgi:hypothetical protein
MSNPNKEGRSIFRTATAKRRVDRLKSAHTKRWPGASSQRKKASLRVKFLSKSSLTALTVAEERKCNALLHDCFENAEVGRLIDGTCVLGMLGTRVVAFMCVSESRLSSPQHLLVHTVCTSGRYRGRGLMRQMFHYMANMPEFANRAFELSASNLVERGAGLNQTARFKIYSKVGFTIPIGTEIRPSGEIVKDVTINPSHREFLYHLAPRSGSSAIVQRRSGDMAVGACYANGQLQERGCIMQSSVDVVKAFTHRGAEEL